METMCAENDSCARKTATKPITDAEPSAESYAWADAFIADVLSGADVELAVA